VRNPVLREIQDAEMLEEVVEGIIYNEICYDISFSKKNSHIPATTSVMLKRGQEILAGEWYACYESIKRGKQCK
jgi:hypothetical protein